MSKRKEEQYSVHHILPRSLGWADSPRNKEVLKVTTHRSIHTLFQNRMIAHQLLRTLDLSEKAMRPEVVKWLRETLTQLDPTDPHDWYIDEAIE